MALGLDQVNAFNRLNSFLTAATEAKNDNAIIQMHKGQGSERTFSVATNERIKGFFTWSAPGRDVATNNATRTAFKNALLALFDRENVDQLPKEVRDVLKAGDFDGKGRPLSARRISAVMTAVTQTTAFQNAQLLRDANFTIRDFSKVAKHPDTFATTLNRQWGDVALQHVDASTPQETLNAIFDAAVEASTKGLDHLGNLTGQKPEDVFRVPESAKPADNSAAVQNFTNALAGWKLTDDQKTQMVNVFKCLPPDVHDLVGSQDGTISGTLTPKVVGLVAHAAQKFGFINGTEKSKSVQQADFNPETWGAGYRPKLSKGSIAFFRQNESQFGANKTKQFPKGVCQAATALWLQRHLQPNVGSPLALKPSDCDTLQYRVEYSDRVPGLEPFNMSLAPKVYKETGGTLDGFGSTPMLKFGKTINPNLRKVLDDMPPKGFIFLQASKSNGKYAHSMAIFKSSENELHFFNPGKGMYKADPSVMVDIIAHNLAGWNDSVTTQSGHLGFAGEPIPRDE